MGVTVTDRKTEIEVNIDELILEVFNFVDRKALTVVLREELAKLLAQSEADSSINILNTSQANTVSIRFADVEKSKALGVEIARALYRSISNNSDYISSKNSGNGRFKQTKSTVLVKKQR